MSGEIRKGVFEWNVDRFLERKRAGKDSNLFLMWRDNCFMHVPSRDGSGSEISQYYTVHLMGICDSTGSAVRRLKVCLIGRNGEEFLAINKTPLQIKYNGIFLMKILDTELREDAGLLPGGTLTVRLSWYEERDERHMEMLETLSRDLSRFHVSNANTDCVLRLGNTELQAHRAVLCARSEVFAAMFRHETAENLTGVVDIVDVEADVMRDCLYYMYAGTVQRLITSNAAPLFIVAEKYRLTLLQEACLSFLTDNLTVENVCDAAVLADTYEKKQLEKKVVQFIGDRMEDIQDSAEWKKFLHKELPLSMKLLFSLTALNDSKK